MVTLVTSTLLDSPEIYKIEFNLISLIDRTFKKGVSRKSGPQLKNSIKQQFSSNTFKIQLDKIIDDLYLYTIDFTDKLIKTVLKADFTESHISYFLYAASTNTKGTYLELTEEAVKESTSLASDITDSIIRVLKDEAIYQESNEKLATRVLDLWGSNKYRAESWARTFSADVATNTTLYRYQTSGIEECQFYATLDERTSQNCRMMHGTVFKVDSSEARQYRCPLHFRCRSTILPVSITTKIPDSLRYENRNFDQPVSQTFQPLEDKLDQDLVKKTFKNIDDFREKYAIPKYILNADTEKRLLKLGTNIETNLPKKTTTPKVSKTTSTVPKSTPTKAKPGISKIESDVQGYEKGIAKQKNETAYVFDKNGKVILEKDGGKAQVQFTSDELKRFKNSIVTHNHPGLGGSFSESDIKMACKHETLEMRAVSKQGIHSFKMKDGSTFKPNLYSDKIQKQVLKSKEKVKTEGMIRINKHEITSNQYSQKYWHWVWEDVFSNIPEVEYKLVKFGR